MEKILTAQEMKRYDKETITAGTPALILMERAARAAFEILLEEFDTARVLILCGSGNNGGDGLAMARLLAAHLGHAEVCYLGVCTSEGKPDTDKMSAECAAQYAMLPSNVSVMTEPDLTGVTAVVDAVFGIGLTRPLAGKHATAVTAINAANIPVLAIDIPSGINADSGAVMGCAMKATKTVAIAAKKYGHLLFPGAQLCGEVTVADIGIEIGEAAGHLLEGSDLSALPPRPRRAHKGTFGRVLVVGGSKEMSGAAYLSAKAAYRAGAGLVEILSPEENRFVYQTLLPEAVLTCYDETNASDKLAPALTRADAVALGMGLSQSDMAKQLVADVLSTKDIPLIVDADALNLIAANLPLRALLYMRGNVIVTPHLAEMSRLAAKPVAEIAADLPHAAASFAKDSGAVVVLKDAHTVIAADGSLYVNTLGNSGMATGGSGDVLAGIIASFAAQGATAAIAATRGVLAHALAGDAAKKTHGNHGLMASDLPEALAEILP